MNLGLAIPGKDAVRVARLNYRAQLNIAGFGRSPEFYKKYANKCIPHKTHVCENDCHGLTIYLNKNDHEEYWW